MIEVLVASAILTAVVSIMTMLYQSSLAAERRAEASLRSSTAIPFVIDVIRYQLRTEQEQQGEGVFQGLKYHWYAEVEKRERGYVHEDLLEDYPGLTERYVLWNVTLEFEGRPIISYKEFSW